MQPALIQVLPPAHQSVQIAFKIQKEKTFTLLLLNVSIGGFPVIPG